MKYSKYCEVIEKEQKVIKHSRKLGIVQEYFRSTPEVEILKILNSANFPVPKVLESNNHYFIEEYINGDLLDSLYKDYECMCKNDIDSIIDNIIKTININYCDLKKYIPWNNVSEFFKYQIANTQNIWLEYKDKYYDLYNLLGIDESIISNLIKFSKKINFDRPLCLIHGDRHKNNMIKKDNVIYFIDWELGCVGDLAYDIAFHIHQMKYNEDDLEYFLLNLCNKLPNEYKSVIKDIKYYLCFITARFVIFYVKILNDCKYSDELLDKFYIRLKKLCDYDILGLNLINKEDVRKKLLDKETIKKGR